MEKYSLYVGKLQPLPNNSRFSYYNGNYGYLLVFTDQKPEGDFIEVTGEPLNALSAAEREWLFSCKRTIAAEHLKKNEKTYLAMMQEFVKQFEEELKAEEKRYAGEQTSKDGNA